MFKSRLFILLGFAGLSALAQNCSSTPADCTQTSTCPSDASDGPGPVQCDTTKDPKDQPGCLDDRVGIFVSPTGSDTNPGTKGAPLQTIGKALTSVGSLTRIYVCAGAYPEDVVITPPVDGISLFGGFNCSTWAYVGNNVTIGAGSIPLKITSTTKAFAMQDFIVKAADGNAASSSSIAALVSGATGAITFTRMNFSAGKGADAPDVATGTNYNAALLTNDPAIKGNSTTSGTAGGAQLCTGLCTDSVTSTGGAGGQGGTSTQGGASGSPNLGGLTPNDGAGGVGGAVCTNGDHGATATAIGADAVSPTGLGALTGVGWAPSSGALGKNGVPGQGGGGGGGNTFTNNSAGGGGGGGCGGCGGAGGAGGSGGGASIALAVISSPVVVNASELHAVNGGKGGAGGAGQVGQAGGVFGTGAAPGCSGGTGGNGSAGGTGAGGVGGLSVGVLYKGTSPTLDQSTTGAITTGTAGTKGIGGKSGTNDGIDGVAMPTMQAP